MHTAFAIAMIAALVVATASSRACAEQSVSPAEIIEIPLRPLPFILQGLLRRSTGAGSPAVVLLPQCGSNAGAVDENWGARLSSWGYATLTIDSFTPRGLKDCSFMSIDYADLSFDAYRALGFLAQRRFANPKRAAIVGFGLGAWQALSAVERGDIEQASERKFRAAAAFYPSCGGFKGPVTVPTLILVGDRDGLARADACRKLAAGEDDMGISRQKGEGAPVRLIVYPGAHFGFDMPSLQKPGEYLGHRLEFNKPAADQAREALREFLQSTIGVDRTE